MSRAVQPHYLGELLLVVASQLLTQAAIDILHPISISPFVVGR